MRIRLNHLWALLMPLLLAIALASWGQRQVQLNMHMPLLKPVHLDSVAGIEWLFDELAFSWPLADDATVPRLTVVSLPIDLNGQLTTARKKSIFIRLLLPLVIAENELIQAQRRFLVHQFTNALPEPGSMDGLRLAQLSEEYQVKGSWHERDFQQRLLMRVDNVPIALVIAQAANESGWGTSRFVRQGNNLFGQWTFDRRVGLVPLERDDGLNHFVRVFPTLRDSVRAYLHNINTHRAYQKMRKLRHHKRVQQLDVNAYDLAIGLQHYSQQGMKYVQEIRRLIRANRLDRLEVLDLRQGTARLVIPRRYRAESKPS